MRRKMESQITLVGAGPGDPDLISVAGVKALKEADVVLYDALVDKSLLKWAVRAQKIFVGKRKGYKRYSQSEINQLLVVSAIKSGRVVRLKGGDPFVFGRGSEELEFAEAFGITTRIIPGISSSTSAGSTQGIPLTKRGVAQSFWVLTGTTKEQELSKDIELAAQSSATLVILMGMSKIPEISKIFKKLGKGSLPVCIVQNAFQPSEICVQGTLDTIVDIVLQRGIKNPAVIIIGEVVNHGSESFKDFVKEQSIIQNVSAYEQ